MKNLASGVPVGLGTVAGLVTALPILIGGLVTLLDGVKTVPQAIVATAALLAGALILAVVIYGRMQQASVRVANHLAP